MEVGRRVGDTPHEDARRALTGTFEGAFTPADRGAVRRLDAFPPALLDEARRLPEHLVHPYLMHVTTQQDRRHLPAFAEQIVRDGGDPAAFGRRGLLMPSLSVAEALEQPVARLLGRIPGPGDGWRALPIDRERWENGDDFVGAPVLERSDLDYRWQPPPGVLVLRQDAEELPREPRPDRRLRRWVAARTALVARARAVPLAEQATPSALLHSALPEAGTPSSDGLLAIEALLREEREIGSDPQAVPGFRGPDWWYEPLGLVRDAAES
jgi:hypothetical protein